MLCLVGQIVKYYALWIILACLFDRLWHANWNKQPGPMHCPGFDLGLLISKINWVWVVVVYLVYIWTPWPGAITVLLWGRATLLAGKTKRTKLVLINFLYLNWLKLVWIYLRCFDFSRTWNVKLQVVDSFPSSFLRRSVAVGMFRSKYSHSSNARVLEWEEIFVFGWKKLGAWELWEIFLWQ